jgi:hypothetical protein
MSNKTIFKRIALVAITALGAGILSVSPATATAIAADEIDVSAVSGVTNSGACSVSDGGQGGTFVNGSLVTLENADIDSLYIVLSGPAVFEGGTMVTNQTAGFAAAVITSKTATALNATNAKTLTFRLNGVGAVTVTMSATSTSAAVDAFVVNSVDSCLTSTFNASKSNITLATYAETDTNDAAGEIWVARYNGIDTADAEIVSRTVAANGSTGVGYIRAQLNNEYGDNLSSRPIVVSSNTPNCWVAVEASDTTPGVAVAPAALRK